MKQHIYWCNKDQAKIVKKRKAKHNCDVCGNQMAYIGYLELPNTKKESVTVEEAAHLNEQVQESNSG